MFSMLIVLPNEEEELVNVEKELDSFNFSRCIKGKTPEHMSVSIPKFEIRTKYEMKSILGGIGVKDIFTNSANLSKIGDLPLYVDDMYHEASIKVTEKGTEHRVASRIVGGRESVNTFHCDRPFIFLVVENEFGSIILKGTVERPAKSI